MKAFPLSISHTPSHLAKHLKQCHGDTIHLMNADSPVLEGDGMLTNHVHLPLCIYHADCQAAIFYDPVNHVCANVHAGWRGQVLNIYQKTLVKMQTTFGSRPQDIYVQISPSLGPQASEFKNYQQEFPPHFQNFMFKPNYFNLWELANWQLLECGILQERIEIAQVCTFSNPQYPSYRRDPQCGRMMTVVQLLPK